MQLLLFKIMSHFSFTGYWIFYHYNSCGSPGAYLKYDFVNTWIITFSHFSVYPEDSIHMNCDDNEHDRVSIFLKTID